MTGLKIKVIRYEKYQEVRKDGTKKYHLTLCNNPFWKIDFDYVLDDKPIIVIKKIRCFQVQAIEFIRILTSEPKLGTFPT